ncbi:hypothetical protein [Frankia sp. QA3]|uniref:hypothetical protein n=1 Tax=Frankia sp. QA3 TaxID=710111 RepID=UPI000269BF5B|nr:hypothetical protein [Frankia sp. QA3]EIV92424.1 hypothetical protein FraQA3DRAFT_1986 [Frankia sp. QA3]
MPDLVGAESPKIRKGLLLQPSHRGDHHPGDGGEQAEGGQPGAGAGEDEPPSLGDVGVAYSSSPVDQPSNSDFAGSGLPAGPVNLGGPVNAIGFGRTLEK